MEGAGAGAVVLADGRLLAFDDTGAPGGVPVVYLHGCPDCRLSRHPDDTIAARAGVRLIAIDRPGYGASDPDPAGDQRTLADDVVALADALGIDRFAVLAWSAGGPSALALAARHPDRVAVAGVACGVPEAAEPEERPDALAAEMAPLVATPGMPVDLARESLLEGKDHHYRSDLASVDGLADHLAAALSTAVAGGLAGVERDLREMATPWPFDPVAIAVPVLLWYGTHDPIAPPAVGEGIAARIHDARVDVVESSHLLPLVRWESLLITLVSEFERKEPHASQP